jgi:hypothetical protein
MNELSNIGFTYDIKTFTPGGEKKDDFSVHNLITDEGIKFILGKLFFPENNVSETSSLQYNKFNNFFISFMTKQHTPNAKDTYPTFLTGCGEADIGSDNLLETTITADTVISSLTGENSRFQRYFSSTDGLNTQTNTMTFFNAQNFYGSNYNDTNKYIVCTKKYLLLTGIFMSVSHQTGDWLNCFGGTLSIYSTTPVFLLSEAMFPEPILLEVGGKLQVNCGCTVISA